MIQLKSLSIANFRSFRKPSAVDFSEKGILYITGPGSGCGKTSILYGIYDGLGACPVPGARLASRGSDLPRQVSLTFTKDDVEYVANRGKSFSFLENGNTSKALPKEQEKALQRVLEVEDPEWISQMTWIKQSRGSWFLAMADADKKALIAKALGVVDLEDAIKKQSVLEKEAEEAVWKAEVRVGALQREIEGLSGQDPEALAAKAEELKVAVKEATQAYLEANKALGVTKTMRAKPCQDPVFLDLKAKFQELANARRKLADTAAEQQKAILAEPVPPKTEQEEQLAEALNGLSASASLAKLDEQRVRGAAKQREIEAQLLGELKEFGKASEAYAVAVHAYSAAQNRTHVRESLQKEIDAVRSALEGALAGVCPTCAQPWEGMARQALSDSLAALELNLRKVPLITAEPPGEAPQRPDQTEKTAQLELVKSKLQEIVVRADTLRLEETQKRKKLEAELAAATEARLSGHRQSVRARASQAQTECQAVADELAMQEKATSLQIDSVLTAWNQSESEKLVEAMAAASEAAVKADKELTSQQMALKDVQEALEEAKRRQKLVGELGEARALLGAAQEKHIAETEFSLLVGPKGYVGFVLDDALQRISARMNGWLARLPNVEDVTCELKSAKVAKNGKETQSVHLVTRIGGQESSSWRDELSGGQVRAVELAVDMAVMSVLSEYTGCEYGWMCLDEPFDGLSATEIEPAMDLLREIAAEKLVLLIDHHVEVAIACDNRLTVSFKNGESSLA